MKRSLVSLLVLFLVGCSSIETDSPTAVVKAQSASTRPPQITAAASTPEQTFRSPTPESAVRATATMMPSPLPPRQVCSPLSEHELDSLFEIISSPYNPPPMGKDDRHQGVDFSYYNHEGRPSIQGEGVTAVLGGWVALVILDRLPYGNSVILETPAELLSPETKELLEVEDGESIYHLYAHLLGTPLPLTDTWVDCDGLLGFVGTSGYNVPVAHLHLETRIGPSGMRFDAMAYYDTRATVQEMANYELWRMSGTYRHFDPMVLLSENE